MPKDPDSNPLHNKEEDAFTSDMLDHVEQSTRQSFQPSVVADRAALVKDLDKRMQKADWYFEYSDDHSVWLKGLQEIKEIKNDLHTLSVQPNGLAEARLLWELHAQPFTNEKPEFLTQQTIETPLRDMILKIEGKNVIDLQLLLESNLSTGLRYMVFNAEGPAKEKEAGYLFFSEKEEGNLAAGILKQQTNQEHFTLPVAALEQRLSRELELQQLQNPSQLVPKDILMDMSHILKLEIAREQIFTWELKKQLTDQGFSSSIAEGLRIGIEQDLKQFEATGMRNVNGKEELFIAKVRQNEDRAFRIDSIVPELETRMEKIDWKHAYYDPLEQNVEIENPEDRKLMYQIWKVVEDVQDLAASGPDGLKRAAEIQDKYWKGTLMEEIEIRPIPNLSRLELEMQSISWKPSYLNEMGRDSEIGDNMHERRHDQWEKIYEITDQLQNIASINPEGQRQTIELKDKYWKSDELSTLFDPYQIKVKPLADQELIKSVELELKSNHIQQSQYDSIRNNTLQALAQGFLQRAVIEKIIVPIEHIDIYRVSEHYHPGHQIYEIGHSLKSLIDTPDYEKARTVFQDAVNLNQDKRIDYVLVGQFRGKQLEVNAEGYPEVNTGIILLQGNLISNKENERLQQISVTNDLNHALKIYDQVIVQRNPANNTLNLYNEQLQLLKTNVMSENVNEENYQYLSKQLKYTGFGESLQPALKEAMQKSVQEGKKEFTLGYVPEFDKEKTVATLHFKQSESSDRFFFNRFNVVVKNNKFPDGVKQGFNVHGYDRKDENTTLKTAYNLTDGRPAMVTKQDAHKEQFSAWGKLDFSKEKANGDFQMQLFNKNYGFELEKVLNNYPIKELLTPSYKEGLKQSLERGNLQSVTFQAGGKEEKLFISPDLKMGALKVYDEDKKLIKPEVLLDKQFVDKDFGNQLVQRIEAIKEKQESLKQDTPKQDLKNEEGQKQGAKEMVKVGGTNEKIVKPPRQRQRKKIS